MQTYNELTKHFFLLLNISGTVKTFSNEFKKTFSSILILELILPSLGYRELILEFIASTFVSMYDLLVLTDVPPRPPPPSDMAPPRPPPPETDDEEDFPIPQANQPIMVRVLY